MERLSKMPPSPRPGDDRVILQFDYDCFYAQVFENRDPALRSRPLGVQQKNILATCNYHARRLGVGKLMLLSEATRICPGLVVVNGEDLTPFRDASKMLFNFLRSHSWNGKVQRLGFDEVFMDVTDMVDYNMLCLNRHSLASSFFHLSSKDPEKGFACDLTAVTGCVAGAPVPDPPHGDERAYLRLLLASHLALHLRRKMEADFGYTSTCGIAPNKLLSKLAGDCNKPRNQTTLLALRPEDRTAFMDGYKTRQVPGLGSKTAMLLESTVLGREVEAHSHSFESLVTVKQVRQHPSISPGALEALLGGPGAERGIGARVWALLHGVDHAEVKEASSVPSQISIEDTYGRLETLPQITEELHKLSCSLVRRMRADLVVADRPGEASGAQRWIARPKTLRLSTRSWPTSQGQWLPRDQAMHSGRSSRSCPLPNFVFDLEADMDDLAQRLVGEALLPLLRRLQDERGQQHRGWNLQLVNVCVANMVAGASDGRLGAGRDIAVMFKKQDEVLRPWKATQDYHEDEDGVNGSSDDAGWESDVAWDDTVHPLCPTCGHGIPHFAIAAHARYHELGE